MKLAVSTVVAKIKGFHLLPSLAGVSLIVLILSPRNGFIWGLFGLFLYRIYRLKRPCLLGYSLLVLTLTAGITFLHVQTNKTDLTAEMQSGLLRLDPNHYKVNGDYLTGMGYLSGEKVAVSYVIRTEREKDFWMQQTRPILIEASFQLEEPARATNRFQFDYQAYLFRQRIHWQLTIQGIHSFTPDQSFIATLASGRLTAIRYFQDGLPAGKTRDYIMAMIFNQVEDIDALAMEAYRKIGTIHLFSISGLHIQFLVVALQYVLLRCGLSLETTRPLLVLTIIGYAFLTGGGVGIFRAVCTHTLLLMGQIADKELDVKDAFALAIFFALWFNPYLVFSIAFQLSFALTGLLYFIGSNLEAVPLPRIGKELLLSLLMTALSGLFLSYHYFEISWLGMFVNIVFSFFFSNLLFPVFWLLSVFSAVRIPVIAFGWLNDLVAFSLTGLERLTVWLSKGNWLLMVTGRPALIWYVGLAVCLVVVFVIFERDDSLKGILLIPVFYLLFNCLPILHPEGRVIMLDVGQGDAILIKTPFQRQTILIDTGGAPQFSKEKEPWQERTNRDFHGEKLISAIKAEGIAELDAVFLTHSDTDHIGNLGQLVNELPVEVVFYASGMEKQATFQSELGEMRRQPELIPLTEGQQVRLGKLLFHVLNPEREGAGGNNHSLVLHSDIGSLKWLFMGDLETEGERALMARYPRLRTDILKVGHHGSDTSTEPLFLQRLDPKAAFISVGRDNRYGHPNPQVIDQIQGNNIHIYRTDLDGAVHFIYKQHKKKIEVMLQ